MRVVKWIGAEGDEVGCGRVVAWAGLGVEWGKVQNVL